MIIPRPAPLRAASILGTVTGRLTSVGPPIFGRPRAPRKAHLRKDGRVWLSLHDIFSDGAEHKRAEVIDYWHARQDGYRRPPRVCFRHPSGDPSSVVNTAFTCSCGPLDRGSGIRELLLLRLSRDGLVENTRHGWWKITTAGR